MAKLSSSYWNKFIDVDEKGKRKGNGIEFEKLIKCLLTAMYGKKWKSTGGSHDNNRDFWIHLSDQSIWAECKNYADTIAMNILAPTLVMAQIYEVNEILFFSRSNINRFAKDKILAFGEKSNKIIRFFDGHNLEELVCTYALQLPKKYSPIKYIDKSDMDEAVPQFVNTYFFQNIVSNVYDNSELLLDYEKAKNIYYNQTFALIFSLLNVFDEESVEVSIEFVDEGKERFSFQYFYPTIVPENKLWYHTYLKKGEGRSISLNMRQISYKPSIALPRFRITFYGIQSGKRYEWNSKKIVVESNWVSSTRLIGENYLKILNDTSKQLANNPYLSSLILTGSSGTGKTRVLTECQNILLKNGYRIIRLCGQENFSSHYFIKELIAFLYEIPSDELLKLLEEKIFLTNSNEVLTGHTSAEKAISLLKMINNTDEENLQNILNNYRDILYEKLSRDKNVLIIDNIQFAEKTFQDFIEGYVYYAVNQQAVNTSVLIAVFNTDYMTTRTSELLYNILHANMKSCISYTLKGFKEKKQGIEFLQELTRSNEDENTEYFLQIVNKISLKPYNLFQTIKYLEELEIIKISPNKKGYITSNLEKYEVLSNISDGITSVLEKRFAFLCKEIPYSRLMHILSVVYIFDFLDSNLQQIFGINVEELDFLHKKNILRSQMSDIYFFDHDIIRDFFFKNHSEHIFVCLEYIKKEGLEEKIKRYPIAYLLYKIVIDKNMETIIDTGKRVASLVIPERISSLFYNRLLDSFIELLENKFYKGIYIKYIHQICTYIRQYDGSQKAWHRSKELYDTIQKYYPYALSEDILFYRPFIHFCCDIAVQTHLNDATFFLQDVLENCKNAHVSKIENCDELNVLQAIMYNRWYVTYNTQSYKNEIAIRRQYLMEQSRTYGDKINDKSKRGLIEYLNNSDEGYNYYGYQKDKDLLFSIWNKCIIDIPKLVPEKTLNYYRKTVQYALIEYNFEGVNEEIRKAIKYLEEGEFSHEPIIFRTFFLMAEVMANIQHKPGITYHYNKNVVDDILKMQKLLDNHKLGDILLLKGVNAYYGKNTDEVYFSFREAYKHYTAGETSRFWIKKELLEENIKYSFTTLGIYKMGYDVSFLPVECRQPLTLFKNSEFIASGIQRTSDLCLNLPLI